MPTALIIGARNLGFAVTDAAAAMEVALDANASAKVLITPG